LVSMPKASWAERPALLRKTTDKKVQSAVRINFLIQGRPRHLGRC
jgi:hypothetical protein